MLNRLGGVGSNSLCLRSKRLNLFDYATFLNKALLVYQGKITNTQTNNTNYSYAFGLCTRPKLANLSKTINNLRSQNVTNYTYRKLTQRNLLESLKSGDYLCLKDLRSGLVLVQNAVNPWRLNKSPIRSKLSLYRVESVKRKVRVNLIESERELLRAIHRRTKSNYLKKLFRLKKAIRLLIKNSQSGRIRLLSLASCNKTKSNTLKTPLTETNGFASVYNKKIKELKLSNHLLGKLGVPKLYRIELEIRSIKKEVISLKKTPPVPKEITMAERTNKQANTLKKVWCFRRNQSITPVSNRRKLLGKLRGRVDLGYKIFYLKKLNILSKVRYKKAEYGLSSACVNTTTGILKDAAMLTTVTLCSMLVEKLKGASFKRNVSSGDNSGPLNKNKSRPTFSYFSTKLAYLMLTKTICNPTINQFVPAGSPAQIIPSFLNTLAPTECPNDAKPNLQDSASQTHTITKFLTKVRRRSSTIKVSYAKASYSSVHLV